MNYEKKQTELLVRRKELYDLSRSYQNKLKKIEQELEKNKEELCDCCIKIYGSHLWKNEDEDGMYGERFVVCQRCGAGY